MGLGVELYLLDSNRYNDELIPAYQAFMDKGETEPLANLLRRVIQVAPEKAKVLELVAAGPDIYREDLDILEGREFYAPGSPTLAPSSAGKTRPEDLRTYVARDIAPSIAQMLCVEVRPNIPVSINMTRTRLVKHLYERSPYIQSFFTFEPGPQASSLPVPIGESMQPLSKEETQKLFDEVVRAGRPAADPELQAQYDGLKALLTAALQNSNLMVVFVVI